MFLNCGTAEDSWVSLGLQGDQTSQSWRKSVLNIHWKDWCWSWSSSTLATWCEQPTHWKRPWSWERLRAGGEGDDRRLMVEWHHWFNRRELGWTPGDSEGQGGLACCSPWGHKESDTTERLDISNSTCSLHIRYWKSSVRSHKDAEMNKVCRGSILKNRVIGGLKMWNMDLLLLSLLHVFKHLDNVRICKRCIFFHHTMGFTS